MPRSSGSRRLRGRPGGTADDRGTPSRQALNAGLRKLADDPKVLLMVRTSVPSAAYSGMHPEGPAGSRVQGAARMFIYHAWRSQVSSGWRSRLAMRRFLRDQVRRIHAYDFNQSPPSWPGYCESSTRVGSCTRGHPCSLWRPHQTVEHLRESPRRTSPRPHAWPACRIESEHPDDAYWMIQEVICVQRPGAVLRHRRAELHWHRGGR
jgi:hypothetical protein